MSYNSLLTEATRWRKLQDNAASSVLVDSKGVQDGELLTANTSTRSVSGPGGPFASAIQLGSSLAASLHVTGTVAYTMAVRFKLNSTPSGTSSKFLIATVSGSTNSRVYVYFTSGTGVRFRFGASGDASTGHSVTLGWHTALVSWDFSSATLYIDGSFIQTITSSHSGQWLGKYTLGAFDSGSGPSNYLDCTVADSPCWDHALTAGEAAEWHAGPEPLNTVAPVLHDDGTVTSGTWDSQNNGTITRLTTLYLSSDDSVVTTSSSANPDFSGNVTTGLSYYVVERASNNGGYDEAEDTASAVVEIGGGTEPEPIEVELGQSTSFETAQSLLITNPRAYTLGQSSSTESSQLLIALNPREYAAGQSGSVETSQSLIVSNPRSYELEQSSSNEATGQLTVSNPRSYELEQSSSTESASALEVSQTGAFTLGQSSSAETTQSLVVTNPRSYTFGQSSSVESTSPLEVSQANVQTVIIEQSSSIEASLPLIVSNPRTYSIGQSVSTEYTSNLIVDDGTVTTTEQYILQTINGLFLLQTQS